MRRCGNKYFRLWCVYCVPCCVRLQLKYLYVCSYMFRSNWTILRERMLSLAKATILWNWSVSIHLYMKCGVVATSISGCDVCTACRVAFNKRVHLLVKAVLTQIRFTFRCILRKQTEEKTDNMQGSHTDVYYVTSVPNSTYRYKNSRKFVTFRKTVFLANSVII